jgi:hypothetical protein
MQLGGLFELRSGLPDKAYRLLIDSAAALRESHPQLALETLVLAGEAAAFIGTPALAAKVGTLAAAVGAGDSPERGLMVALLGGLARALGGDPAGGAAMLREVVVGAQRIEEPAQLLWAGRAALYLGELSAARTLYERGADQARLSGAVGMLATVLDRLAWTDAIAGRPSAAEANAEEGLKLAGELGLDAGVALGSLALVSAMRGDEAGCRATAEPPSPPSRRRTRSARTCRPYGPAFRTLRTTRSPGRGTLRRRRGSARGKLGRPASRLHCRRRTRRTAPDESRPSRRPR